MSFEVIKDPSRVYLDYNATTPLAQFIADETFNWAKVWGNPSSTHQSAAKARALLWQAREETAQFIGCHPLEIIWTSGGSEANNHAIKGLCEKFRGSNRKKIITSAVEHSSVSAVMKWAEAQGFEVSIVPVSKEGRLDLDFFEKSLDETTAFVSIMYANNETGCIFPIEKLAQMSREKGALFHCDAVQALGKMTINIKDLGVDLLTLSGHKFYSLKGCGVLYCRKGLLIDSLILGGPQERKRRAGTENVLSACAFGAVCRRGEEVLKHSRRIKKLRDSLEKDIQNNIPDVQILGKNSLRTGNSSSLWIKGVFAETVMMNLDVKGYSVSVSSACHSGSLSPSRVLLGMGYSPEEAQCVLRVSLGVGVQEAHLKNFTSVLKEITARLRSLAT